jgi:cytochrome c oxidase subunit 2
MKSSFHGLRTRVAGALAGAAAAFWGAAALAQDKFGEPTDRAIDLQPGVTPLRNDAIFFHNIILMPIITAITLFVLALLVWVVVKYNRKANPVPAKFSHNTTLEVAWTLIPVLILVFIAIFSFKLLFAYNDMPKPDLTVKATGYQWYWGYEYPDQKIGEFVSNILPEDQAKAQNKPYRLAATEPLVVPVNKVVRVQVTGADVIHAFAVPSFGIITDAIPGRLNETWFKAPAPRRRLRPPRPLRRRRLRPPRPLPVRRSTPPLRLLRRPSRRLRSPPPRPRPRRRLRNKP